MFAPHMPPGMPGSLTWKARQVGLDPYHLALSAAAGNDRTAHQARFYLAMMQHQRMRSSALAAAAGAPQTI